MRGQGVSTLRKTSNSSRLLLPAAAGIFGTVVVSSFIVLAGVVAPDLARVALAATCRGDSIDVRSPIADGVPHTYPNANGESVVITLTPPTAGHPQATFKQA